MLARLRDSSFTVCLFALCVDLAMSCFGKKFILTVPTEKEYQLMGKTSIFTYHEEVQIGRRDSFNIIGHDKPLYINAKGSITLHRHRKIDIEVRFNSSMYLKFKELSHYVHLEGDKEFGVNMVMTGFSTIAVATILPTEYYGTEFRPFFLKYTQIFLVTYEVPQNGTAQVTLTYFPGNIMQTIFQGAGPDPMVYPQPYKCTDMEQYSKYRGRLVHTAAGEISSIKRGKMNLFTGNCKVVNRDLSGLNCTDKASRDDVLDSSLATHFAAREFIAFKGVVHRPDLSYVVLVGVAENNTDVFVHTSALEPTSFTLHAGQTKKVYLVDSFQLINSSRAIQVYLVFSSACLEGEVGGPSMTSIIPNVLFDNRYMWSLPYQHESMTQRNFIVLVKKANVDYEFVYNGDKNYHRRWTWSAVAGTNEWLASEIEIFPEFPEVFTVSSSNSRGFGCYLYGIDSQMAYLNYVGFLNTPIFQEKTRFNPSSCNETEMTVGDLKDNDCDGMADEESSTTSDDDGDGLKGEDVIAPVPKLFDKDFKEIITTPAPIGDVVEVPTTTRRMTTLTPWRVTWVMTTEKPKEEMNYMLLIILILFLIASAFLLYYLLSQKRPKGSVAGEHYLTKEEREARRLRRSMELTKTDSKDRNWKSPYAAPGRTKSTYLH